MSHPRIEDLSFAEVWAALGGGPLRAGRGRAFWRGGDGFNVSIDAERGRWFDHAEGVGGGIVTLVEKAIGDDRRAALDWLDRRFGTGGLPHRSRWDRRGWAQRMQRARVTAAALAERRDEYLMDLRTASGLLLAEYHRLVRLSDAERDIDALAKAEDVWEHLEVIAGRREHLRAATGGELVAYFLGVAA